MKYIEGYKTNEDASQDLLFRVIFDFGEVKIEKATEVLLKEWSEQGVLYRNVFPFHLSKYRDTVVKPDDGEVFLYALADEYVGSRIMCTDVMEE